MKAIKNKSQNKYKTINITIQNTNNIKKNMIIKENQLVLFV